MAALHFTDANWEAEVLQSKEPVVVDFWAVWCGPCRVIAPLIEELSTEYAGKVKVGKLDVDANGEASMKYGVRSIPTVLIFKDGQVVDQIVGAVPKQFLVNAINRHTDVTV